MTSNPQDRTEAIKSQLRVYGKERVGLQVRACAIYARVSTDEQETIPMQLARCRKYAADALGGMPVLAEFFEKESGLANRSEYNKLKALANTGRISHVVTWKNDRATRDNAEFQKLFRDLEQLGIELHDTTVGRIDPDMAGLHGWLNEFEVRRLSARVTEAMKDRAEQGKQPRRAPFGYTKTPGKPGCPEIDLVYGPIITELFTRYAAGESIHLLAKWFNESTGFRKRSFGIVRLLQNPYYAGICVYNQRSESKIHGRFLKPRDEWIIKPHDKPLVDQQTWDMVQARLALNANVGQQRVAGPSYPLTGLVWCAQCAKRVHGQPDMSGKYPFYHCPYCGKGKSNRKIEQALRRSLDTVLLGVHGIEKALTERDDLERDRVAARGAEIVRRIDKLHERRGRLTTMYADGDITQADYHAALKDTDIELEALRIEQEGLSHQEAEDYGTTATLSWLRSVSDWTQLLDDATVEERNGVYRQCIAACTIDYVASAVTIRWLPAIARLLKRETDTVAV